MEVEKTPTRFSKLLIFHFWCCKIRLQSTASSGQQLKYRMSFEQNESMIFYEETSQGALQWCFCVRNAVLSEIGFKYFGMYRSGSHFGSHRILGHITSRLPHQLMLKPRFYCVPTVFLYVFVELTWHIRHDPKCENRWNF